MKELKALEAKYGFTVQPDYREFLVMAGGTRGFSMSELPVWPGVSTPSDGTSLDDFEEDDEEYWYHDLAHLFALGDLESEIETNMVNWHDDLLSLGCPIGRGYGGDLFLQMADGSVHHLWPDEWDEDAVEEYVEMNPSELMDELYSHHLANDFKQFYAELCRLRGAA